MTGYLEGKNIVVTGAGNGIGRAIALGCAQAGANVVVADYGVSLDGSDPSSEVAEAVVAEIESAGGTALALASDISTMEGGAAAVQAAVDTWGSIDGAVCVAGILRERMIFNMTEEEFDDVIRVHLKGHFTVYKHASAIMRKQETGGSLVGITSGAFTGSTSQCNYASAKGGIISLTKSAALALKRYGINANCIAPSAKTRMSENVPFEIEAGAPEDVAPLAVYLLSDVARDITAQVYTVVGPRISVWAQFGEVRSMYAPDSSWTPEGIEQSLPRTIGTEEHPTLALLEAQAAQRQASQGST